MLDKRTLRQKLEAMANQTASPREAVLAREALARLDETAPRPETSRALTREQILAAPESSDAGQSVRFWSGSLLMWITVDAEDLEDSKPLFRT